MDIWLEAPGKSSTNLHDKKALVSFCLESEQIPRPLQPMQGHRWELVNRVGKGGLGLPGAQPTLSEGRFQQAFSHSHQGALLSSILPGCGLIIFSFHDQSRKSEKKKKKKNKARPQLFHLHKHKYLSFSSEKGFPATVCVCVCVCVYRHYTKKCRTHVLRQNM